MSASRCQMSTAAAASVYNVELIFSRLQGRRCAEFRITETLVRPVTLRFRRHIWRWIRHGVSSDGLIQRIIIVLFVVFVVLVQLPVHRRRAWLLQAVVVVRHGSFGCCCRYYRRFCSWLCWRHIALHAYLAFAVSIIHSYTLYLAT